MAREAWVEQDHGASSYTAWRWPRARRGVEGLPVIIVRDGELLEEALAVERVPVDEVLQAARRSGISDLGDVAFAVLEPGGTISFIERQSG